MSSKGLKLIRGRRFHNLKSVRAALVRRGGWLEVIRKDGPLYSPHLSTDEFGWPHGLLNLYELIDWAEDHLTENGAAASPAAAQGRDRLAWF